MSKHIKFIAGIAIVLSHTASGALDGGGGSSPDMSSYFDSSWNGLGFVMGYGSRAAYIKYACFGEDPGTGQECDGPPEEGIIGKFTGLVDKFMTAGEFATCSAIPTEGTKDVSITPPGSTSALAVTLTFGTPNQSIPAGWTGGGTKYDRRITLPMTLAGGAVKFVVEMSCKHADTGMVAFNQLVGSHAPGFERQINVFVGKKDNLTTGDLYVVETKPSAGQVRTAYGFHVDIDQTNKKYWIWGGVRAGEDGVNYQYDGMDTLNLAGNYQTHEISLRIKRFLATKSGSNNSTYLDPSSFAGLAGFDQADVAEQSDFALLQSRPATAATTIAGQGCMDFDTPTTASTTAAACSGLDYPGAAPVPVIDASGTFSASWILGTAKSKLVEIPAL